MPPPDSSWLDPVSRPRSARWPATPLRVLLERQGISHEDLADVAGTTVAGVRRALHDSRRFTTEQAERLAHAVRIAPSAIWPEWNDELGIRSWEPMPWHRWARCTDENDLFFGPFGERPEAATAREHFAITEYCAHCPVRVDCRDYARRNREYGVWGGETELERALAGFGPTMPIGNIAKAMKVARVYGGEER
jgi:WhiB family redox-sensing transcriptional regulator